MKSFNQSRLPLAISSAVLFILASLLVMPKAAASDPGLSSFTPQPRWCGPPYLCPFDESTGKSGEKSLCPLDQSIGLPVFFYPVGTVRPGSYPFCRLEAPPEMERIQWDKLHLFGEA